MPHDWRPSARSHTSGQSSRNFRRIPHRKTTANTSASNYDKSQPTLTANDQKTTFSDDRQHVVSVVASTAYLRPEKVDVSGSIRPPFINNYDQDQSSARF